MIDVADLTFAYPGSEEPAVRGIGFAVGRGEICCRPLRCFLDTFKREILAGPSTCGAQRILYAYTCFLRDYHRL